ncbi:MAG: hypothetical protein ACRDRV_11330 [Pseudonocardiaceae bacterium]
MAGFDTLVIFDCEQVLKPCARPVEVLLRAAPALRVVATSREPLAVPGRNSPPSRPAKRGSTLRHLVSDDGTALIHQTAVGKLTLPMSVR